MPSNTLVTVWESQARWSAVANRLNQGIVRARSAALILGILGAVLATCASYDHTQSSASRGAASTGNDSQVTNAVPPTHGSGGASTDSSPRASRILSVLSVIALALAAALTKRFGTNQVQNWISARSVSEALKEELFFYLTHVPPYAGNSGASPENVLDNRHNEIVKKAKDDLNLLAAGTTPTIKQIPDFSNDQDYINKRVNYQITKYYEPKAASLSKRLNLFQSAATTLTVSAAAISAVAYFQTGWLGAWVAVATTISAALTAYAAAARYQHDSIAYFSTAQQLKSLRDRYTDAKDATAKDPAKHTAPPFENLVRQCEEVISIENQGWMANWQKDPNQPSSK